METAEHSGKRNGIYETLIAIFFYQFDSHTSSLASSLTPLTAWLIITLGVNIKACLKYTHLRHPISGFSRQHENKGNREAKCHEREKSV